MRIGRLLVCSFACFSLLLPAVAQQTAPQAVQLLRQAFSSLGVTSPITDITLSGSAHFIAGSADETGTAILKAIPGASRIDLNLSSGPRSEIWNSTSNQPAGKWSDQDGVSHSISNHNLLTEPAWFFPPFLIAHGLSTSGYLASYVGHETKDSQAVEHLSISQRPVGPDNVRAFIQRLSQTDLYLDSTTLLPAAMAFNMHPDQNAGIDIPIEIRFSDYRTVSGIQIPFHVQKYLNNGLILDLQFNDAAVNSGLPASTFSVTP